MTRSTANLSFLKFHAKLTAMTSPRALLPLAVSLSLLSVAGCGTEPPTRADAKQGEAQKAGEEDPAPSTEGAAKAPAAKAGELTPEELALIEADPKDLSPEENRKRGYALRKKILQNPDSPAAQALEEAKQAALAGQLEAPGAPDKPADNGVVIPAPDYLKNQDQSYAPPEK
jgi:hypothetical protein